MCPGIDNLVVTFVEGNETHAIVSQDLFYFIVTFLNQFIFFRRDKYVGQVERQTSLKCHVVS